MRKIVLTLALTIALLFFSIGISPQIGFAATQTIVTISADGTINPTFAPIQREGEVYTLTDDVGAVVIGRSGIVFDGNGHSVTGTFEEKKIYLAQVKNVTLKNLVIEGSAYGILLDQTSNITVTNNIVKDTSVPFPASQGTAGIYIYGGANNTIVGNLLENNVKGIVLVNIFECSIISENNIKSNYMGMVFWNASNNSIYHNNFINNSLQVFDSDTTSIQANMTSSLNSWDNDYPYGGNYWSDYHTKYPNAGEINSSGIGNTSYVIDSENKDRYPLMEPFNSTYYLLKITSPKIVVLSNKPDL
jgi:parallel beta-helix repeat protein